MAAVATKGPASGSVNRDEFTPGRDLFGLLLDVGRARLIDTEAPSDTGNVKDFTDNRTGKESVTVPGDLFTNRNVLVAVGLAAALGIYLLVR